MAPRPEDTNWAQIVSLYDRLWAIRPSPVVALNRAIAVAQLNGPERGLEEIHAIADRHRLARYPFYSATLGELELRRGRPEIARQRFRAAVGSGAQPRGAAIPRTTRGRLPKRPFAAQTVGENLRRPSHLRAGLQELKILRLIFE